MGDPALHLYGGAAVSRAVLLLVALSVASCAKCGDTAESGGNARDGSAAPLDAAAQPKATRDAGAKDATQRDDDDDDEPHADAGTTVVPRTEVHMSEDIEEPEFKGHGFPALSEDKKILAYFFVDGDLGPTAGHAVVLVDTAQGKVDKTLTLVRRDELSGYVERGKAYGKEPWQERVAAANAALAKHTWTAVAYAPGVDWNDETEDTYQGPSPVDGLLIGIADPKKPTTLVVKEIASGKVLLQRDVKTWQKGIKGSLGFFDYAASRELAICVMKSRVVDEPYTLRIVTFGPDAKDAGAP
jgi:hypothetical protein